MIAANDEALEVAQAQETGGVPVVVVEGDLSRAPWTVGRRPGRRRTPGDRSTCSTWATSRSRTWPVRQHWTEARARLAGWQRVRARPPGSGHVGSTCWATGPPRAATRLGQELARRTRRHRGLRRQRPDGDRGPARALGGRPLGARRRSASSASTTSPRPAFLIPPLTTVRQDFDAVGRRAIEILQVAMRPEDRNAGDHGGENRRGRLIKPELVRRASTARVPGGGRDPLDAQ